IKGLGFFCFSLGLQLLGLIGQILSLTVGIFFLLSCLGRTAVIVALGLVLGILAVIYGLVIITLGLSQSLIGQIQISCRAVRGGHSFLRLSLDPGLFQRKLQLFYLCLFLFYRLLKILGIILKEYLPGSYLCAGFRPTEHPLILIQGH